jgi:hypothetical protein
MLTSLWRELPFDHRQKALRLLTRVVAEQLDGPPTVEEVANEQD